MTKKLADFLWNSAEWILQGLGCLFILERGLELVQWMVGKGLID